VANAALAVTGAGSAGGFAAFMLNIFRVKIRDRKSARRSRGERNHGSEQTEFWVE
jgi:hypothetical protein